MELRKASRKSMQEVELRESQDSESMESLQDTFMRDASDEASVDPDASKEETQLVTEATKLKQQVKAGGAEKDVSHQVKMERAAAKLDLQQRSMLKTKSKSGGPCSISKSTMEELCAHGEDNNCLNQKAAANKSVAASNSAVAKAAEEETEATATGFKMTAKQEAAQNKVVGPEDQALAKLS